MRRSTPAIALALAGCSREPPSQCDPPRGPSVGWFADGTARSGLSFPYAAPDDFKGAGLAVADVTGDGLPDVVAGRRGGGLALFQNLGGLRFVDVTLSSGLDGTALASALAVADLDGDGDRELVVAGDGVAHVYDNRGAGAFVELAPLATHGATEHVLPVDLDGDGLLDLYVSNYDIYDATRSENRLYLNRGGLAFSEPAAAGQGASWTASALDVDRDGDLDLYVANDTLLKDFGDQPPPATRLSPDLLLRNDGLDADGALQLTDVAAELGLAAPRSSMGGLVADFDRDERLDLYVPDYGLNKLFLGQDGGGFVESAGALGLAAGRRSHAECGPDSVGASCLLLSWSAVLADFDLDGRDELLVTNGEVYLGDSPPVQLFAQAADGTWAERDPGIACGDWRAAVAADLDADGDLDLLLAPKDGPLALYENRAPRRGRWLGVTLAGAVNRDGIGAKVIARLGDGRAVVRAVGAGGTIHASAPHEVHFGLGMAQLDAVEVEWPSGRRVSLPTPAVDGLLTISEGQFARDGVIVMPATRRE